MTLNTEDILFRLIKNRYPLTPEDASALIVNEMLSDLPVERRESLRAVIEEWASEWGNLVGSAEAEAQGYSS